MSEDAGPTAAGGSLDVPTIREGIAKLDLFDQKYVVMSTLQELKGRREKTDDSTESENVAREEADIAFVAINNLPYDSQINVYQRAGTMTVVEEPQRDPNAWRQMVITYGVLFVFGVITLAFVLGVAFQVKGVDDLGTAFTTLLAAVTGFFAGRGEGQAAPSPADDGGEQRPRD